MKNRNHSPIITWPIGTKVWLEGKNITITHPSAKLAPKQWGPFPITAVINPVTYKLELPHQWKIHPVFHTSLLHPYKETVEHGPNFTNPPLNLVGGEQEFEVEEILDSRLYQGKVQYRVKWKGYSEITWEPVSYMENTWENIEEFHMQHPDAIAPISQANDKPKEHVKTKKPNKRILR